jgi:hypothetical protein
VPQGQFGICTGNTFQGDPFQVTAANFNSTLYHPYYKLLFRLDKSQVILKVGKNGSVNAFDTCLGAKNILNPPPPDTPNGTVGNCNDANPAASQSWRTKNGTCAVFYNGLYWGLAANLKGYNKDTGCPQTNSYPGILNRSKNNAGDVLITLCKPWPFDGFGRSP